MVIGVLVSSCTELGATVSELSPLAVQNELERGFCPVERFRNAVEGRAVLGLFSIQGVTAPRS